jgi:SulP family sulfate permease
VGGAGARGAGLCLDRRGVTGGGAVRGPGALLLYAAFGSFISEPVLKGFIIGLALTIVAGRLPKLFGIEGGGGTSSRSSGTC